MSLPNSGSVNGVEFPKEHNDIKKNIEKQIYHLSVSGMTCAACVSRVEKKLGKLPGVQATVNLANNSAEVVVSPEYVQTVGLETLLKTVEKAGYSAKEIDLDPDDLATYLAGDLSTISTTISNDNSAVNSVDTVSSDAQGKSLWWSNFIVSLILTVPVVLISMVGSWHFPGWQWVVTCLSIPICTVLAWPFYQRAGKALRGLNFTMDTLISLGIIVSGVYSLYLVLAPYWLKNPPHQGHLYFETAAMIVTFMLLGRHLEARSRRMAGSAMNSLLQLRARSVEIANGKVVPVKSLEIGDIFKVYPGERIATDGEVLKGFSAVDTSLLTGESQPVEVNEGDQVLGGTINTYGSLLVRTNKVGRETVLSQVLQAVQHAQVLKPPVARLADRICAIFVPIVLLIALLTGIITALLGLPIGQVLARVVAVLVVACPCALGLATPTVVMVASDKLSQLGVMIRNSSVFSTATKINTLVVDKTGTLTWARGKVNQVFLAEENEEISRLAHRAGMSPSDFLLQLAAAVESDSEHPIGKAIVRAAAAKRTEIIGQSENSKNFWLSSHFTNHPGEGVSALVEVPSGETYSVMVSQASASELNTGNATVVEVAWENSNPLGYLSVVDEVREDAPEIVTNLQSKGIQVVLATGDNQKTALEVGAKVGILTSDVHAHMRPEDKKELVLQLQNVGKVVAMMGDGANDAAALACADLGVAMGSGSDSAIYSADMVLMTPSIGVLEAAFGILRRADRLIKENLAWAFGYNALMIPLAASGVLGAGVAAFFMASSSVIVVTNSLRLRK